MEKQKPPSSCTCEFKLGSDQISSKDIDNSKKLKLVNESILFLGASDSVKRCTIEDKLKEIRDEIGEFYFSKETKLIAIPNQIPLPKKPIILDPDETNLAKIRENKRYMDQYYEDLLHQSVINELNKEKLNAFVMMGFQSGDFIKAKLEKSKNLRNEEQCKCKADKVCQCGGKKYPDLNAHEKEIMEILEIKNVDVEELTVCTQWLKDWKQLEDKDSTAALDAIQPDKQSWLLNKVI